MRADHLTPQQVFELNEEFGWFQYGDAQGHVSKEFAQAVIEKYELMRSAAPALLKALQDLTNAVEGLGYPEGGLDGFQHVCDMTGAAYSAIAAATGKKL